VSVVSPFSSMSYVPSTDLRFFVSNSASIIACLSLHRSLSSSQVSRIGSIAS
jgi:hypothetical protein